jgi:hypothetical protein
MSNSNLSGETTLQPIPKTESSAEFDPVLEIRKLRQNLIHRIQTLHFPADTTPNLPVSTANENTEEIKKKNSTEKMTESITEPITEPIKIEKPETIKIETIKNVKNIKEVQTNTFTLFPATTDNKTKTETTTLEFPANELVQQLHHTRQLLSQLQIMPLDNKSPAKPENNKPENDKLENNKLENIKPENFTVSQTEPSEISEQFFPPLAVLKILNTGLTWCGFSGILFSLQYLSHDDRFGLTIIIAGLTLITVGLLGRFFSFTFHKNKNASHKKSPNQSFA